MKPSPRLVLMMALGLLVAAAGAQRSIADPGDDNSGGDDNVSDAASPMVEEDSIAASWGTVAQPTLPQSVCSRLVAGAKASDDGSADGLDDPLDTSAASAGFDTGRLQSAIDHCAAGSAVQLAPNGAGGGAFISGPLTLKSGVTLWIDRGATLYASRDPQDYDLGDGRCGTADKNKTKSCKPLILATGTVHSGIVGEGRIDGRGGSLLSSGPNALKASWWDLAYLTVSKKLVQHVPRLIQIDDSRDFTLYRITLLNSPNFHVVSDNVAGLTAWGIKILSPSRVYTREGYQCPSGTTPKDRSPATCFTPETVKNTDGFDPGESSNVLLAYSYIASGDDAVAVKAHGEDGHSRPSTSMRFAHNQFYYSHGFSIGSETDSGVSGIQVSDLAIDGFDSVAAPFSGNGLRIKSDDSRGGRVEDVSFENVCLRNVARPIVLDTFYSATSGKDGKIPDFRGIAFRGIYSSGSRRTEAGEISFYGYARDDVSRPIEVTLDNVVLHGGTLSFAPTHNGGPSGDPASVHFHFDGGPVSFFNQLGSSSARDVTLTGAPGAGAVTDCRNRFVVLKSVLPESPI